LRTMPDLEIGNLRGCRIVKTADNDELRTMPNLKIGNL